jgi:hypothetical protein
LAQNVEDDRRELVLFEMEPVWIRREVGEQAEIPIGNPLGVLAIASMRAVIPYGAIASSVGG